MSGCCPKLGRPATELPPSAWPIYRLAPVVLGMTDQKPKPKRITFMGRLDQFALLPTVKPGDVVKVTIRERAPEERRDRRTQRPTLH